jgi:hypothetical protein
MVSGKKKQIVQFSDGSCIINKTLLKTSKKISILDKDHITFIFNRKNKTYSKDLASFKDFKFRYLKL